MLGDKFEIIEVNGKNYQAAESNGTCTGCAFEDNWEKPLCSEVAPCLFDRRANGKEVIWLKLQHGKDPKSCTIQEAKQKIRVLQQKIQDLIQEFEAETATRVDKVDLNHFQELGGAFGTRGVEISAGLN